MSFGGFIARRLFRGAVYGVIDTFADDKEQAKEMKEDVRWLITIVGAVASIATADAVGFIDTITDHGTDVATDTVIDHVTDHGVDAATEHLPSYYDGSDAITNDHELHFGSEWKGPDGTYYPSETDEYWKTNGYKYNPNGTTYKV